MDRLQAGLRLLTVSAFFQASSLVLGVALTLLVLVLTAFVLGRLLTGTLNHAVERWAIPTALGLAVLAHLGWVLGLAGLLRPWAVLLVVAGIHGLGFRVRRRLLWNELLHPLSWRHVLLGMAALLPLAALTLYPPTAFDATLYHLPFARGFVTSGGLPFLADLRFPVFPQVNEMLFALVMLFAPDVAAHGVSWLMTMLTAGLVFAWARDAFSGSKGAAAGWLAAAIYLGNPIVVHLAVIGYVEAGLTLFVTSALYAVRRWRGSGERRWLILAAVFAATAADTKYLGLFFLGAMGLTVLCGPLPERGLRARWAGVLLFGVVAVAVLAPWYGRIVAWTGNPLFPYFPQVFGSSPWEPFRFRSFVAHPTATSGASTAVSRGINLVRLPWDLVFERDRYNGQPPFSPLYLAALPLGLVAAWNDPRQRRLLALTAIYVFVCLGLPPDSRYLLPIVPLVSLSAAGALLMISGRIFWRGLTAGICVLVFLPGWLYAIYRFHHLGALPLTPAAREAYLARWQPCYPAVASLNRTLGSGYTVWAFHAENMSYYARGRFLGDWAGPARFGRVLDDLRGTQDLHDRLRGLDAGYLLIPSPVSSLIFPQDALEPWFQRVYADPAARVYKLR
ncbi:MAG TPA: glycosyltransferase family 39 protein [Thermoanaerobaculia bacterium]|nr:glycosyltransferase family 39 protein [Thermoanaerobaculia bacterium]